MNAKNTEDLFQPTLLSQLRRPEMRVGMSRGLSSGPYMRVIRTGETTLNEIDHSLLIFQMESKMRTYAMLYSPIHSERPTQAKSGDTSTGKSSHDSAICVSRFECRASNGLDLLTLCFPYTGEFPFNEQVNQWLTCIQSPMCHLETPTKAKVHDVKLEVNSTSRPRKTSNTRKTCHEFMDRNFENSPVRTSLRKRSQRYQRSVPAPSLYPIRGVVTSIHPAAFLSSAIVNAFNLLRPLVS
ncbi:hypothetical protein CC2G_013380 [Coprinopsis cinerea AmutBmut pab1-1]|nr:hypothetical protein CC2G_013380 [Coprinopsis cinerea AmutBmut pab1-1]